MSKIYSRPRIRLPIIFQAKFESKENRKKKKMLLIFTVMLIAIVTAKTILEAVLPIFDTLCMDKAKSLATIISNEQATIVMREHSYEELFSVEKDNSGNVIMIRSNVSPINEIISDIAVKIQKEIDNQGRDDVEIAIRKFYRI